MASTLKIIGLMSCGFLLCLGLYNAPQAVAGDGTHTRQPGGPRVGGQGGKPDANQAAKGEAGTPHTRQSGGPRVGGQGGQPDAAPMVEGEKAGTPHTRQPGGPRVGGQGGQP